MRPPALLLLLAAAAPGQSLQVYSEFQRPDPFGNVAAPDRAERSREILSPAVARNAWASFHVAVEAPEGENSFLYVQQNPERFRVTAYRERFVKTNAGWIPDALERVKLPCLVLLPDRVQPIPGQTTAVFWLDVWVPGDIPAQRVRLEILLKTGSRWIVYPMEVRVLAAVLPPLPPDSGRVPAVAARADASLRGVWCGAEAGSVQPRTVRQMIRRNAQRDALYAKSRGALPAGIENWCRDPKALAPEWYLNVRYDLLRR
ncbi:MAG: hypothetical protein ACE15B_23765 [Bryobacteraceae bacterium]